MEWSQYLPVVIFSLFVFIMGLMIGSFINVLVARLPYEKSIVWPSSRCFACYRRVRFTDNIPILSFLRLRGKCRDCGASFSSRHLWVELGTGIAFLGLFFAEIVFNYFKLPGVKFGVNAFNVRPSPHAIAIFLYHALLIAGLIAAAVVDAEHRIIPAQITYPVMIVGIIGAAFMPWPWPNPASAANTIPAGIPWMLPEFAGKIASGVQPWPFWGPVPDFAPAGSWKLGLLNGVLGALAGSLVVRATKWLFETGFGREALGLGDADLLMMAGAFLGWQIAVMSLFIGSFAAIVLKLLEAFLFPADTPTPGAAPAKPEGTPVTGPPAVRELAFAPGLAIGVGVTWFAWPWLGPKVQFPFFDATAGSRVSSLG